MFATAAPNAGGYHSGTCSASLMPVKAPVSGCRPNHPRLPSLAPKGSSICPCAHTLVKPSTSCIVLTHLCKHTIRRLLQAGNIHEEVADTEQQTGDIAQVVALNNEQSTGVPPELVLLFPFACAAHNITNELHLAPNQFKESHTVLLSASTHRRIPCG